MPIKIGEVESEAWWFNRLLKQLNNNKPHYQLLDDYYSGRIQVPRMTTKAIQESYSRLMKLCRLNFGELIVEAVRERMIPVGFKTALSEGPESDKEAWAIWQANHMDADHPEVHRSMLSMGVGYVIVGKKEGKPLITPEDPREVIVELDPLDKRTVLAGLKVYYDDFVDKWTGYLYLPGRVIRAQQSRSNSMQEDTTCPVLSTDLSSWDWVDDELTGIDVVPVVPFRNKVANNRVLGEYENHISHLDRLNYLSLTRLEIISYQAFRQRGIEGIDNEDENGNEIDYSNVFDSSPGAMWLLPTGAKIWEGAQTDLSGINSGIENETRDLAALTRTPLYYFVPEANDSAEGAALAKEGLVFKTKDRIGQAGESWEQVMSLAFLMNDTPEKADRSGLSVIWADPERFSLSERYDAATKAKSVGIPFRTIAKDILQMDEAQIAEMETERSSDAFLEAVGNFSSNLAPATPAPVAPVPNGDIQPTS